MRELEAALAKIDTRGGTAMRDAIQMSIDHLKRAHRDKKVLVVITDGNDNSSVVGMDSVLRNAHKSGVLLYGVGLLTEEEHREAARARKALNDLAEATGGKTFFPKEVAEVDAIARQVAHDIRNQYTIAYTPSIQALDGSYRQIRVVVDAPGKPVVRTRTGYYATPDAAALKEPSASTPGDSCRSALSKRRTPLVLDATPISTGQTTPSRNSLARSSNTLSRGGGMSASNCSINSSS